MGVISRIALMIIYGWIALYPYTHIYPMSIIVDTIEKVCEDGKVTTAEQTELTRVMNEAIQANE